MAGCTNNLKLRSWIGLIGLVLACFSCDGSFEQNVTRRQGTPLCSGKDDCENNTPTYTMASVGDSISRGFLAEEELTDAPHLNWSTGLQLATAPNQSHFHRLISAASNRNFHLRGVNVAESGASADRLSRQITSLQSQSNLIYTTVLIGANDLCLGDIQSTSFLDDFEGRLRSSLNLFLDDNRFPVTPLVVVSSMPNLPALFTNPTLSASAHCSMVWAFSCPNWQQTSFNTTYSQMNQRIATAVADLDSPNIVHDGGALAAANFTANHVSDVDCFHPSLAGQGLVSSTLWNAIDIPNQHRSKIPFLD